jgi:hypothetical protein
LLDDPTGHKTKFAGNSDYGPIFVPFHALLVISGFSCQPLISGSRARPLILGFPCTAVNPALFGLTVSCTAVDPEVFGLTVSCRAIDSRFRLTLRVSCERPSAARERVSLTRLLDQDIFFRSCPAGHQTILSRIAPTGHISYFFSLFRYTSSLSGTSQIYRKHKKIQQLLSIRALERYFQSVRFVHAYYALSCSCLQDILSYSFPSFPCPFIIRLFAFGHIARSSFCFPFFVPLPDLRFVAHSHPVAGFSLQYPLFVLLPTLIRLLVFRNITHSSSLCPPLRLFVSLCLSVGLGRR